MQLLTNYQYEKDPAKITRLAVEKYNEIKNNKDALLNLSVPGIGSTLTKNLGGIAGALIAGPKGRQDYLKNYDQLVQKLVKDGEEAYVRSTLARPEVGISPTEIEERIHPLTPEKSKA